MPGDHIIHWVRSLHGQYCACEITTKLQHASV